MEPKVEASAQETERRKHSRTTFIVRIAEVLAACLIVTAVYREYQFYNSISQTKHLFSPRLPSYISDAIVRAGLSAAPILLALAAVAFVVLPRTRHDLRLVARMPGSDQEKENKGTAIRRFQLFFLFIGGGIGCVSWIQTMSDKRQEITNALHLEFERYTGTSHLAPNSPFTRPMEKVHCLLCQTVSDSMKEGDPGQNPEPTSSDPNYAKSKRDYDTKLANYKRWTEVRLALNFYEKLVYYREVRVISETEFFALWAGPIESAFENLRLHLEATADWRTSIEAKSPLLYRYLYPDPTRGSVEAAS